MTHKILLSTMARAGITDVSAEVEKHARDMKDWLARKRQVDGLEPLPPRPEWIDFAKSLHPAEDYTAAMEKWTRIVRERPALYPAPTHLPDIMAAVNENGEPDFELVDDSPTPEATLAAKKADLFARLTVAENAALEQAVPHRKRRLLDITENDIRTADAKRMSDAMSRYNAIAGTKSKEETALRAKLSDPDALHAAERPPEHQRFMEEQAARKKRCDDIARIAAQASSDIEDLTIETIDSYQLPSFE